MNGGSEKKGHSPLCVPLQTCSDDAFGVVAPQFGIDAAL
jgi:hypothetical protein